ncbi:hypothetical protein O5466_06860 [Escherichia coli]|nr:hypothetical protein [Escherichia coli]
MEWHIQIPVMKMEKYRFWHVAVCAGGGGKGSVAFDIDGKAIITDFLPFLTYMLRNADYVKLSDKVIREEIFMRSAHFLC